MKQKYRVILFSTMKNLCNKQWEANIWKNRQRDSSEEAERVHQKVNGGFQNPPKLNSESKAELVEVYEFIFIIFDTFWGGNFQNI